MRCHVGMRVGSPGPPDFRLLTAVLPVRSAHVDGIRVAKMVLVQYLGRSLVVTASVAERANARGFPAAGCVRDLRLGVLVAVRPRRRPGQPGREVGHGDQRFPGVGGPVLEEQLRPSGQDPSARLTAGFAFQVARVTEPAPTSQSPRAQTPAPRAPIPSPCARATPAGSWNRRCGRCWPCTRRCGSPSPTL